MCILNFPCLYFLLHLLLNAANDALVFSKRKSLNELKLMPKPDYIIWGLMQECMYKTAICKTSNLKQCLIDMGNHITKHRQSC